MHACVHGGVNEGFKSMRSGGYAEHQHEYALFVKEVLCYDTFCILVSIIAPIQPGMGTSWLLVPG